MCHSAEFQVIPIIIVLSSNLSAQSVFDDAILVLMVGATHALVKTVGVPQASCLKCCVYCVEYQT